MIQIGFVALWWLSVNQIYKIYMKNYLLSKTNRIRPSRTLYGNPFRNDNSLKNICQSNQKSGQQKKGFWQLLWEPILALNLNGFYSFLDRWLLYIWWFKVLFFVHGRGRSMRSLKQEASNRSSETWSHYQKNGWRLPSMGPSPETGHVTIAEATINAVGEEHATGHVTDVVMWHSADTWHDQT